MKFMGPPRDGQAVPLQQPAQGKAHVQEGTPRPTFNLGVLLVEMEAKYSHAPKEQNGRTGSHAFEINFSLLHTHAHIPSAFLLHSKPLLHPLSFFIFHIFHPLKVSFLHLLQNS